MTDVYRDFPYERTIYAQYQGYMKTEVEQVLMSPDKSRIILVPYNEPDGNWFAGLTSNASTLAAFEAEWLQTYNLIKGRWPQARIAGPNFSNFFPAAGLVPTSSTTTTGRRSASSTRAATSVRRCDRLRRRTSTRSPWRRSSSRCQASGRPERAARSGPQRARAGATGRETSGPGPGPGPRPGSACRTGLTARPGWP